MQIKNGIVSGVLRVLGSLKATKIEADSITGNLSGNASTATTLTGLTATVTELNKLDGMTATTAELNYVDGVTSNIQTQLNGKSASGHSHTKLDNTNIGYGTCSTAASTAAKVIAISGNTDWALKAGSRITVKFTYTNTAQNPTFNVNGTGAKSVWYNTGLITTSSLSYAGYANRPMDFVYDGTQYVFTGWSIDSNSTYSQASLGQGYGTCSTAEATTEKAVTLASYSLQTNGIVAVKFTYNVPASATMNINGKGAKPIYRRGSAITANQIKAGDIATFIYNGSQYHLITLDRDDNTVYTHPTTSGNKHIPSGGSSGQILKWSASGTAVWGNESGGIPDPVRLEYDNTNQCLNFIFD